MTFEDVSAEPIGLPRREPTDDIGSRVPVEVLASEYVDALRVGKTPSIEEYIARFPDYADELRSLLPLVAAMEEWKTDKEQTTPTPLPQRFNIQRLGDCRIIREIGRGGMGVVFEGIQESVGRRVAVKLLPWRFGKDELWRERFQREAQLAAALRHANIVPVFRFGEYEGHSYYVMPLIVGMGLDWVIDRLRTGDKGIYAHEIEQARMGTGVPNHEQSPDSPPNPRTASIGSDDQLESPSATGRRLDIGSWKKIAKIGAQAASALRYAHGRGLLHRDIKPANLLLDTSGTVWITDFGLAQPIEQVAQTQSVAGTLRYMPPEQLDGTADERSDLYSLGVTMYELATLQHAIVGDSRRELMRAIREGKIVDLSQAAPGIPRPLADIISRAMETDPDNRFPSADAMTAALLSYLNRGPTEATRSGWLRRLFGG